ncbi:MAG: hypothetical protein KY475_14885 [Planctomycetes bacterium]|nr:hypothetical protein [Planctomycetota bacterium]
MSLIEMLLASAVMAMIATAVGALAMAVNTGSQYSRGRGEAVQHARVALDRIQRACLAAHANETFPGFFTVPTLVDDDLFPDTLVVWRSANPADPAGLPRYSELVIFAPDPANSNRLLEITAPGDQRTVPSPADLAAWRTEIAALISRDTTTKTQLTDLLRTAAAGDESRGAVRFDVTLRPSDEELSDYRNGDIAWSDMPWAQSIHGGDVGLRQTWCRIELQLVTSQEARADAETALTFFGSAAIYYGLTK